MAPSIPSDSRKKSVPKRPAHMAEAAFQRLQQAILSGELKEGDRVREQRLAREWKTGRTPMREAVRRAAEFGYLVLRPNHAPVVRRLTAQDVRQIYSLREVIECFALRGAWDKIVPGDLSGLHAQAGRIEGLPEGKRRLQAQFALDHDLHQLWSDRCENPWLVSCLERLLIHRPNLVGVLSAHRERVEEAYQDHRQILDALERRDMAKASDRLAAHIRRSGQVLAGLIEGSSPVK